MNCLYCNKPIKNTKSLEWDADLRTYQDSLGTDTAFIIGNGYYSSNDSAYQYSNAFRINYQGQCFGGTYSSNGADYAESFGGAGRKAAACCA